MCHIARYGRIKNVSLGFCSCLTVQDYLSHLHKSLGPEPVVRYGLVSLHYLSSSTHTLPVLMLNQLLSLKCEGSNGWCMLLQAPSIDWKMEIRPYCPWLDTVYSACDWLSEQPRVNSWSYCSIVNFVLSWRKDVCKFSTSGNVKDLLWSDKTYVGDPAKLFCCTF